MSTNWSDWILATNLAGTGGEFLDRMKTCGVWVLLGRGSGVAGAGSGS